MSNVKEILSKEEMSEGRWSRLDGRRSTLYWLGLVAGRSRQIKEILYNKY